MNKKIIFKYLNITGISQLSSYTKQKKKNAGYCFFSLGKKNLLFKRAQFPLVHSILKGLSNDFEVLLTECCAKWGKSVSGQTQERKWLFLSVKFFNCPSQSPAQNTLTFHEDLGKTTITLCYRDCICFNWSISEITVCRISVSGFHLQIKQLTFNSQSEESKIFCRNEVINKCFVSV